MPLTHADAVSVVVVNHARRELLRACLRSLARQTVSGFEVILVDNGSSDGSVAMARAEFGEQHAFHLRVIENPGNRGFCAANNQGFAASRSEFVALLNNDAEASPGWLAALLAVFDGQPRVGMAASKILVHGDPRRIDKVGHLIYWDGQNRGRGSGEMDEGQYDRVEETLWPDGCAAMYRRALLDQVGGFDEDLFAYADDAELGLRGRLAGWECLYAPEAVVRHHRGATLGVASGRRLELIERNRILLAAKLFPWRILWLNGAFYAARLVAGLMASLRGQGETRHFPGWAGKWRIATSLVRGDLQALAMLPRTLAKRQQVRSFRRLTSSQVTTLLWRHRIRLRSLTTQGL